MSDTEKPMLYLQIEGHHYRVERVSVPANVATSAWRLTKDDGGKGFGPYLVMREPSGRLICECASFLVGERREERFMCKHLLSVVGVFGEKL